MNKKTICFIVPYPVKTAPSQRFRMEQYFDILKQHGYKFTVKPFITKSDFEILYHDKKVLLKFLAVTRGFLNRFLLLFSLNQYEFVFIHREATPVGPPIVEWIISKVFRKKIIYDFDDAIWKTDKHDETTVEKMLRSRSKVSAICRWSHKVSCGNAYLASYAKRFNQEVIVNPTTVDTDNLHNADLVSRPKKDDVIIGWTGSHSTLKYLSQLVRPLQRLQHKYNRLRFMVIADQRPTIEIDQLIFRQWSEKTEIQDLIGIDIGVMPLPDDEWTKGKCGFKALQYMALEIPAVVSAVGVNNEIITHGVDGFCCVTENDWVKNLEMLINNAELRKTIGAAGRKKIVAHYSVAANTENFLSLFQ
jgi:glycosyltransferase involved in cell wall biosynthesis